MDRDRRLDVALDGFGDDKVNVHKELAEFWKGYAMELEARLRKLAPPSPFFEGDEVEFVGRPAWGVGVVAESYPEEGKCLVRFHKDDPSYQVFWELNWEYLQTTNPVFEVLNAAPNIFS